MKRDYVAKRDVWYEEEKKRIELPATTDKARRGEPQAPDGKPAEVAKAQETPAYLDYVAAWEETTAAYLAMPKKPRIPANPPVYEGFDAKDFEYFQGYGYFTAGVLSLNTRAYGSVKAFGTVGQNAAPLNKAFWEYSVREKVQFAEE